MGTKYVGNPTAASSVNVAGIVHVPHITVMEEPLTLAEPSDKEVWAAINRIHESRTMTRCAKLMQLLKFVVKATLKSEAGDLKETTIGVLVFGRQADYDPKADTIVRSQAWRLRAKLRRYYATEGAQDRVVVSLPEGHYIPFFQRRYSASCSMLEVSEKPNRPEIPSS
jgi:hypothetical protein